MDSGNNNNNSEKQPAGAQNPDALDTANIPPELLRNYTNLKKKQLELEKQLEDERKKNQSYEDERKRVKEEYATRNGPRAEEVTEHMKEIAKMIGNVNQLSAEWEAFNRGVLTDPSPLGQEVQAVQVACSRGFRQMQAELEKLKKRNGELEQTVALGVAMSNVDENAADLDGERGERRAIKAERRNKSLMQRDESAAARPVPEWAARFMGGYNGGAAEGRYIPPADQAAPIPQNRTVVARRSEPVQPPVQQQQQQKFQEPPAAAAPSRFARIPGYADRKANSMSTNADNAEFWRFTQDLMGSTDFTTGALATLAGKNFGGAVTPAAQ